MFSVHEWSPYANNEVRKKILEATKTRRRKNLKRTMITRGERRRNNVIWRLQPFTSVRASEFYYCDIEYSWTTACIISFIFLHNGLHPGRFQSLRVYGEILQ